jgi:hypothetical protein
VVLKELKVLHQLEHKVPVELRVTREDKVHHRLEPKDRQVLKVHKDHHQ